MNGIELQPGSVIIDFELVETLQATARVLVETSATISAGMSKLERTCPYADDSAVIAAIDRMRRVAGDAALAWERLDQGLCDYEIGA